MIAKRAQNKYVCHFFVVFYAFSSISICLLPESESALTLLYTHTQRERARERQTHTNQRALGIRTCNWHNMHNEKEVHSEREMKQLDKYVQLTFACFYLLLLFQQLQTIRWCLGVFLCVFLGWEKEHNCCHSFCFDRFCLEIHSTVTLWLFFESTHNRLFCVFVYGET